MLFYTDNKYKDLIDFQCVVGNQEKRNKRKGNDPIYTDDSITEHSLSDVPQKEFTYRYFESELPFRWDSKDDI